jgi:hypothetical protein
LLQVDAAIVQETPMSRIIIAAAALSLLAAQAAKAEDYPPCTQRGQDHCRVGHMNMGGRHHHHMAMRHHHYAHHMMHHHHHM